MKRLFLNFLFVLLFGSIAIHSMENYTDREKKQNLLFDIPMMKNLEIDSQNALINLCQQLPEITSTTEGKEFEEDIWNVVLTNLEKEDQKESIFLFCLNFIEGIEKVKEKFIDSIFDHLGKAECNEKFPEVILIFNKIVDKNALSCEQIIHGASIALECNLENFIFSCRNITKVLRTNKCLPISCIDNIFQFLNETYVLKHVQNSSFETMYYYYVVVGNLVSFDSTCICLLHTMRNRNDDRFLKNVREQIFQIAYYRKNKDKKKSFLKLPWFTGK